MDRTGFTVILEIIGRNVIRLLPQYFDSYVIIMYRTVGEIRNSGLGCASYNSPVNLCGRLRNPNAGVNNNNNNNTIIIYILLLLLRSESVILLLLFLLR